MTRSFIVYFSVHVRVSGTPPPPSAHYPSFRLKNVEASTNLLPLSHAAPPRSLPPSHIGTIWETLLSDPSFSLLTAALNSTDLARSLDADGGGAASSYTLFAPDNEAIEASSDFPQGDVTTNQRRERSLSGLITYSKHTNHNPPPPPPILKCVCLAEKNTTRVSFAVLCS